MSLLKAVIAIVFMMFLLMFGSRHISLAKDFFYFNPSFRLRRLFYIRCVPKEKISLAGIALQCLMEMTVVLQIFSFLGTNILKPLLQIVWFGKYIFQHPENPYFQTVFCVAGIFFPGALLILIYYLICALLAPPRED